MTKYICLLRGINVGGKNKIKMAELKDMFHSLGYSDLSTYIQSGNIVFSSDKVLDHKVLAKTIENGIAEKFQLQIPALIRTKEEMIKSIKNNPFLDEDVDIKHLHLTYLDDYPNHEDIATVKEYDFSPDKFEIIGKDLYLFIPGPSHKSKLTLTFFEKKLKVKASSRNWKTSLKLLEMVK